MKLKYALIAAGLAASSIASATTVNGVEIAQPRIDAMVQMVEQQGQPVTPETRQMVVDQLVTAEVLRQQAVKQGLDKSTEFRAVLENMQTMALAGQLIKDYQKRNPVTDAALQAEYDKLKAEMPPKQSYLARHILVGSEAEARAVIASLKKGKPFAQLAKEKSKDPGSKNSGGELGWSEASAYVPEFGQALAKLQKGQVTAEPVKTQFGWHVIQLEDVKSESLPPLDTLRAQLTQRVQGQMIENYINDLKKQAQIK